MHFRIYVSNCATHEESKILSGPKCSTICYCCPVTTDRACTYLLVNCRHTFLLSRICGAKSVIIIKVVCCIILCHRFNVFQCCSHCFLMLHSHMTSDIYCCVISFIAINFYTILLFPCYLPYVSLPYACTYVCMYCSCTCGAIVGIDMCQSINVINAC
jgi:hypothetical protein